MHSNLLFCDALGITYGVGECVAGVLADAELTNAGRCQIASYYLILILQSLNGF
jgi:hypothetical protein